MHIGAFVVWLTEHGCGMCLEAFILAELFHVTEFVSKLTRVQRSMSYQIRSRIMKAIKGEQKILLLVDHYFNLMKNDLSS